MHSSWQWLLAVQKIARGSWWLVCCESPGDPEATVAVSCWPEDRSKGYKQMVTGVSCRYFHFQNGSTRTLLAAYAITVGETRARWQALASPGEKQCALLREHLALPSPGPWAQMCTAGWDLHLGGWWPTKRPQMVARNGARQMLEKSPLPPQKDVFKGDTSYLCIWRRKTKSRWQILLH